jgi:nitroreductase
MRRRAEQLRQEAARRRSVRNFSPRPVPIEVLRSCIGVAAQAPSGANKQPWTFVLITNPELKRAIRAAAEVEERAFYQERAPHTWLRDLEPIGTTWEKPFLEEAPALIAVFAQLHGATPRDRHYYVSESVGLASGFLILALHQAGLASLTYTPSPMRFLTQLLGRPRGERPYLLLPVGYPSEDAKVPVLHRKELSEVLVEFPP